MKNKFLNVFVLILIVFFLFENISIATSVNNQSLINEIDLEEEFIILNSKIDTLESDILIKNIILSIIICILTVILTLKIRQCLENKNLLKKNKEVASRVYNEIDLSIKNILQSYKEKDLINKKYNLLNKGYMIDINILSGQLSPEEIKALNLLNYKLDHIENNRIKSLELLNQNKKDDHNMKEFIINLHSEAIEFFYNKYLFQNRDLILLIEKLYKMSGNTNVILDLNKRLEV